MMGAGAAAAAAAAVAAAGPGAGAAGPGIGRTQSLSATAGDNNSGGSGDGSGGDDGGPDHHHHRFYNGFPTGFTSPTVPGHGHLGSGYGNGNNGGYGSPASVALEGRLNMLTQRVDDLAQAHMRVVERGAGAGAADAALTHQTQLLAGHVY